MFDSSNILDKAKMQNIQKKNKKKKLEKQLDEQIQIGMSLNVQGTPTLFDKDGKI